MTSGEIRNFQISAPTYKPNYPPYFARQLLNGWCYVPGDTRAYVQVRIVFHFARQVLLEYLMNTCIHIFSRQINFSLSTLEHYSQHTFPITAIISYRIV